MIGLGSANRDAAALTDPAELRPGRTEAHLSFGYGIHYCAGAALARQEAAIAVRALLARFRTAEEIAAVPDEGLAHRGYAKLVLRFSR
jgi:cytochrome P450